MNRAGSGRARRAELTAEIRSLDTLANPDYAACFEVAAVRGDVRSPEQWARAVFEDAPRAVRVFIVTGWIAGLGIRLGPRPSPDHVLGWTIEKSTADVIVLSVQSAVVGIAHLTVQVEESRVVLASFVRYNGKLGRIVWPLVVPVHHQILRYLLAAAARN